MTSDGSATHGDRGILGVHIAGDIAFLALRSPAGTLDDHADLRRVERSGYMDEADALYDFMQRFQQRVRECQPNRVTLLNTRRFQAVAYNDAFRRVTLQSAIMIACRAEGVPYSLVGQSEVATELSLRANPKAKELADAAARLQSSKPPYWSDRSLAFAAATTYMSRHGEQT
jgi:hypothetical protein